MNFLRTILPKTGLLLAFVLLLGLISGCGAESGTGNPDYKETKTMVMDILKSEEAEKIMEEVSLKREKDLSQTENMRMLSSPEGQHIQQAVKDILTDPNYPKHLEKMMTDVKFAGEFAKAVEKENKQLHKDLMKDPEYQTQMLELMNNEEYRQLVMEVLRSKDYRKHTMTLFEDAMENPKFKLELLEIMKKAVEEENKKSSGEDSSEEGGGKEDKMGDEEKDSKEQQDEEKTKE